MKKRILFAAIVALATVSVIAGCLCQLSKAPANASALANIEALADGENVKSCNASAFCFKSEFNYKTNQWEDVIIGSVSCTGKEECKSGEGWVMCDGMTSSCETY